MFWSFIIGVFVGVVFGIFVIGLLKGGSHD